MARTGEGPSDPGQRLRYCSHWHLVEMEPLPPILAGSQVGELTQRPAVSSPADKEGRPSSKEKEKKKKKGREVSTSQCRPGLRWALVARRPSDAALCPQEEEKAAKKRSKHKKGKDKEEGREDRRRRPRGQRSALDELEAFLGGGAPAGHGGGGDYEEL